ncbi:MAG: YcgN family cysteine cluster protein, partial [Gammaproteobacteria bacterium]
MNGAPFWKRKTLSEMTLEEWESLCDGCAKCCLHKLEDADSGKIYYTRVVCDLIDLESCRCTQYSTRCTRVSDCLDLKRHNFSEYNWLPATCAYKLLAEGKDLPSWHPLVSKNPDTVFESGVSIRSYAMKESEAGSPVDH